MGSAPPDTYAEVIEFCQAVGMDNMDWDAPFGIDLSRARGWELEFFMVLGALGGSYLGEGNQPAFQGSEGLQALELILEVYSRCIGDAASLLSNNGMETGMHQGTLPMIKLWASRAAGMSNPDNTDLTDVIAFAPAPSVVPGGPRAGSAWNDFFFIPAATTNDPDLIFRVIMEAADAASQQQAATLGIPSRVSASDFGGNYLPAANQTLAESVGNYAKNPAVNIVITKLSEFLPLTATGDGVQRTEQDSAESAKTLALVEEMIFGGLNQYDGDDPDSQDLVKYWHPEMQWHGPRGVGSSLGIDEFRERAQGPILRMVPDRKGVGHRARIAEGHFAASTGWPASVGTMTGDFLDWPASGREMRWNVMDFWRREGDLLLEDWVLIDMIDGAAQAGVNVWERAGLR